MPKRLTERQRQSTQARKLKARQQWQCALRCKLRRLASLAVAIGIAVLGYGVATGEAQLKITQIINKTHQTIASTGLAVEHIHLAGRGRTGMAEVKNAIGVELGESMLRLDLAELRTRLESIPTIKQAAVSRVFPNEVYIYLTEREPVAVWQHQGELKLIDELGAVITDLHLHQYKDLPQLVGTGAPQHINDVMELFAANERLASQIQSVIRVGGRRWDVRFKRGITIKLPEEHHKQAWQRLIKMNEEQELLGRHIQAIDMRNVERMYITIAPGHERALLIPTKDT